MRGKWRVGMVAVRGIAEGEELVYDYGVRSEDWMKARKKARSREQDVPDRDSGCVDGATGESREGSPDVSVVEISRKSGKKVVYKRNFFWCPEQSGPVQKVTQHLQKVHKMDPATAARVASKKRQATPEAVRLKMPNPKTRSSGLQHIALFAKKTPATPSPVPRTSSLTPPVPPCTPGTSKQALPAPPARHSLASTKEVRSWMAYTAILEHVLGVTGGNTQPGRSPAMWASTSSTSILT